MLRFRLVTALALCGANLAPATYAVADDAPSPASLFNVSAPAVALDTSNTLLVALRIQNAGGKTLKDVRISRLELDHADYEGPTALPLVLGDMAPDQIAAIQGNFDDKKLRPEKKYRMSVSGSYQSNGEAGDGHGDRKSDESEHENERRDFELKVFVYLPTPAGQGLAAGSANAQPIIVTGANLPPYTPVVGDRNEALLAPVPHGIAAEPGNPAAGSSGVMSPPGGTNGAVAVKTGPTDPVVFVTNTSLGTNLVNGSPPDMSGASTGSIAFVTYNTTVGLSIDGGTHFTTVDPTTIFPSAPTPGVDGGYCCDQQAIYVPQIDRLIWLMQFWPTGPKGAQSGHVRIASASPATIIATGGKMGWTYWDLTSATFSLNGNWMDYPALAYGNNYLYMTINDVGTAPGGGRLVVRIPLAEIRDSQTINMGYIVTPGGCYPTQNSGDTVYWAKHNNNKQMRVWAWPEDSNLITPHDVDINPWPDGTGAMSDPYVSIAPNGNDWTESEWTFPGCTRGATQRLGPGRHGQLFSNEIWFAWTAVPGGGFPNVHIQVVSIDPVDFTLINQDQIWNPNYAFAYTSLTTNSQNEVGVAAAWGGGTQFNQKGQHNENSAVGFFGDHVLYITGTSDDSQGRWGDYITVRPHAPNAGLFSADVYSTKTAAEGGFEPHYVLFGRNSVVNPSPPPK